VPIPYTYAATKGLSHALTIGLWVQRRLCQQNRMFFRRNTQLVVESVVPNSLHVVPIRHDAVLDRVLEGQDTTLSLRFISNEVVFP